MDEKLELQIEKAQEHYEIARKAILKCGTAKPDGIKNEERYGQYTKELTRLGQMQKIKKKYKSVQHGK